LDYLSRWLQEKRKVLLEGRAATTRAVTSSAELEELRDVAQISSVELVLSLIPPETISTRALECESYARALFHWEQHLRQKTATMPKGIAASEHEDMYLHLQDIYAEIDEPDGIAGISAHMSVLAPDQQVLEYRRAGRWTTAQSWYEQSLLEEPGDQYLYGGLFECFREDGRFGKLYALFLSNADT